MRITMDWLNSVGTSCGPEAKKRSWNADQLAILGVAWPPTKGWMRQLVGKEISESDAERVAALRGRERQTGGVSPVPDRIVIPNDPSQAADVLFAMWSADEIEELISRLHALPRSEGNTTRRRTITIPPDPHRAAIKLCRSWSGKMLDRLRHEIYVYHPDREDDTPF